MVKKSQAKSPRLHRDSKQLAQRDPRREASGRDPAKRGVFDIVILGSGSAAFAAAIKATELGATVAMTEHDQIGGTCVNRGCIPSNFIFGHWSRKSPYWRNSEKKYGFFALPCGQGPTHRRRTGVGSG